MLPKHNVALFIFLAAALIIGATAIIIPSSRTSLYLLFSLLLVLFSPLPIFLGRRVAANDRDILFVASASSPAIETGYFLAAWFVTSALIWPLFMARLGWVRGNGAVAWVPIGVLIMLSSMLCYNAVFNRDDFDESISSDNELTY